MKSIFIIFFLAAFLFSVASLFVIALLYKNNKRIPERKGTDRRTTERRLRERRNTAREYTDRRCSDRRINDRRIKIGSILDRAAFSNSLSPSLMG